MSRRDYARPKNGAGGSRGTALAATASVLSALVVGCTAEAGDSDDSDTTDTTAIQQFQPGDRLVTDVEVDDFLTEPRTGECTIAFLPPYNIEFFQAVGYGTVTEAENLGCEVTFQAGQGYGDPTTQLKAFDTALAQGVDGIIIGPVNEQALAPAIDRAWAQGVPVVFSEIVSPSERQLAILTDNRLVGEAQAEHIASADPAAKVISFCGPPGLEFGQERCAAFADKLAELAPDADVVAEKYHPMERSAIANIAGNTLEAFPDATWVFNSTDVQSVAVVDALRNKNLAPGEVKVTTLGSTRESVELLADGWNDFALAERGVLVGRLGVRMLVSVLNGDDLDGAWAWAPRLPAYTAGPDVAEEFCAGPCESPWQGEAALNFAPDGFSL